MSVLQHYDCEPVQVPKSRSVRKAGPQPVVTREDHVSMQGRLLTFLARRTFRPIATVASTYVDLPLPLHLIDNAVKYVIPTPSSATYDHVDLPRCRAEVVRAYGVLDVNGRGPVVLYLHGGAFVACGLNTHRRMVTNLSREADVPVLSVDYRMAPQHPISNAIEDCLDGYQWLLDAGYSPEQIVIAGDSAGGYLAFMTALTLIQRGERGPAAIVAISPLTELDPAPKQQHANGKRDALFSPHAIGALATILHSTRHHAHPDGMVGPLVEPTREDLSRMPRTIIHVSSSEILEHDADLMAHRLAEAGVPVELKKWAGQMHDFQVLGVIPEAIKSLSEIGDYIREATS